MQKFPAACKHTACLYKDLFRELIGLLHLTVHLGDLFDAEILGLVNHRHRKF